MDMMNLIQNLSPAQMLVTAVLLPWMVVGLMHLVSSTARLGLDDNFKARADAVLRWADRAPDPVDPVAGEVLAYRARAAKAAAIGRGQRSYFEDEAA